MAPQPTKADLANTLAETLTHSRLNLPEPPAPALHRYCLVTVGATAPFTPLVTAAFDPAFLAALIEAGYTRLVIQAGKDAEQFQPAAMRFAHPTLRIDCFDFVDDLKAVMVMCGKGEGERETGVVVCHAGTGTVLDAMGLNVPMIVVPNPVLQDNHQLELAEELERQRYALHSDLTDLPQSLRTHEAQKSSHPANTPANPVPVSRTPTRDYAPTIWDIASHIAETERQPSAAGARMASVLSERERESFERLVEG